MTTTPEVLSPPARPARATCRRRPAARRLPGRHLGRGATLGRGVEHLRRARRSGRRRGGPAPRSIERRLDVDAPLALPCQLVGELPAAGAEPAARRRVGRAGHVAGRARSACAGPLLAGSGSGTADSSAWVYGCDGALVDSSSRVADLDDLAQVHHRDPVGDVPDHRQVVGDEQVGQPELVLQVLEQVDHAGLDRHVQRRHRLVEHEQLRARSASARAMPMRWRWPPENSCG